MEGCDVHVDDVLKDSFAWPSGSHLGMRGPVIRPSRRMRHVLGSEYHMEGTLAPRLSAQAIS
jgi:hypothetical protein